MLEEEQYELLEQLEAEIEVLQNQSYEERGFVFE